MTCKGFVNWGHYCNPKLDDLFAEGASRQTLADRQPFYRQATDIFMADQPDVVIYHWSMLWGLSAKLSGFAGRPDGLWRPEGLTLTP